MSQVNKRLLAHFQDPFLRSVEIRNEPYDRRGLDHGVGHLAYIPTKKNGVTPGFRPKPGVCGA